MVARRSSLALLFAGIAGALSRRACASPQQRGGSAVDDSTKLDPDDPKLPNGKSQRDEILKADRDKNIKDASELVDLAQQLRQEIEKNDAFVFSLATLKKTDEIEKLVKKIRGRIRHN